MYAKSELTATIPLSENGKAVLERRYLRRGADGTPIETIPEMFHRVAGHIASVEEDYGGDVAATEEKFYQLLTELRFLPNSPTFTGAGTPLGQLAACFVLPISDDMGRDEAGIFQTLRNAALVQQTGGGNGFAFSNLRPKGDLVKTSSGHATGPVGFLRVYDQAFGEVAQGGCLTPDTLVFTRAGLLRLDELVEVDEPGWQEHQVEVATDEGARVSPRGYNNGVAPVLQVRTNEGLVLTGTYNHKVKVMTEQGPVWRRLDELAIGDSILVMLGQHRGSEQPLRHPRRYHGNQVMLEFPDTVNEELAFLLGYMAGDGFVASGESDHRIGFSVAHSSYLMQQMPDLIRALFPGATVHTQQKENDGSATFVVDNRSLKEFMMMNGFAKPYSHEVFVPRLIRQSSAEVVGAYLRGLFEADGHVMHGYPTLSTVSGRLKREVTTLLIGLGCPVSSRTISSDDSRWGDSEQFAIRISSHVGRKAWREMIGCDPESRFQVCYLKEADLSREQNYALPCARYWIEPVLEATRLPQLDKRGRGMSQNFRSTSPKLRRKLLRYARGDRNLTLSAYKRLAGEHSEFAEHARPVENRWFSTITSVQEIGESLTLDLEVEENHTYLANGLVTHNTRRGANMAVLRVSHPDIYNFISCKASEYSITNFNISVGITDEFMHAVENDTDFDLVNPRDGKVWQTVQARDLFNEIVKYAHANGEPGVLFLDTANRSNPVPHLYSLESTNPCGEQWLGPYENCCLGSINLARHVTDEGQVDWEQLERTIIEATHFLDNVVTVNAYVPAVPQLKEAAYNARRIGLGIMGLADLMYHLGVRYGSYQGQLLASRVMEFVSYHCMSTSIKLAKARGAFPAIKGSIYDSDDFRWQVPTALVNGDEDWERPALDWDRLVADLKEYGIRNAAQTTVAPTGTIASVSGCEGYGCEPVFALAYIRHLNDHGKDVELQYTSPLFEQALIRAGVDPVTRARVVNEVTQVGTCQHVEEVPAAVRNTFVVASDIMPEEHVRMQGAIQAFVDNSISKTVNFPSHATQEDVATAYQMAWKLGCKGITVYVTGSREKVVLETHATKAAKEEAKVVEEKDSGAATPNYTNRGEHKRVRPRRLKGATYAVESPVGKAYVTVNRNGNDQPFEVFANVGKVGTEGAAMSEAIGRLISLALRLPSHISPNERLEMVVEELEGIGGPRSVGFGPSRVTSLPDALAQVLREDLDIHHDAEAAYLLNEVNDYHVELKLQLQPQQVLPAKLDADLCPECGHASFVRTEGCRKCYSCSYSEC